MEEPEAVQEVLELILDELEQEGVREAVETVVEEAEESGTDGTAERAAVQAVLALVLDRVVAEVDEVEGVLALVLDRVVAEVEVEGAVEDAHDALALCVFSISVLPSHAARSVELLCSAPHPRPPADAHWEDLSQSSVGEDGWRHFDSDSTALSWRPGQVLRVRLEGAEEAVISFDDWPLSGRQLYPVPGGARVRLHAAFADVEPGTEEEGDEGGIPAPREEALLNQVVALQSLLVSAVGKLPGGEGERPGGEGAGGEGEGPGGEGAEAVARALSARLQTLREAEQHLLWRYDHLKPVGVLECAVRDLRQVLVTCAGVALDVRDEVWGGGVEEERGEKRAGTTARSDAALVCNVLHDLSEHALHLQEQLEGSQRKASSAQSGLNRWRLRAAELVHTLSESQPALAAATRKKAEEDEAVADQVQQVRLQTQVLNRWQHATHQRLAQSMSTWRRNTEHDRVDDWRRSLGDWGAALEQAHAETAAVNAQLRAAMANTAVARARTCSAIQQHAPPVPLTAKQLLDGLQRPDLPEDTLLQLVVAAPTTLALSPAPAVATVDEGVFAVLQDPTSWAPVALREGRVERLEATTESYDLALLHREGRPTLAVLLHRPTVSEAAEARIVATALLLRYVLSPLSVELHETGQEL